MCLSVIFLLLSDDSLPIKLDLQSSSFEKYGTLFWVECYPLNQPQINYFYFPFLFYTPAPNWHIKIAPKPMRLPPLSSTRWIVCLRLCLLALMPHWQTHCELEWATFLFKLVIVAVRQELFILLLQTGRSGSVSWICSLIEVPGCWLHHIAVWSYCWSWKKSANNNCQSDP